MWSSICGFFSGIGSTISGWFSGPSISESDYQREINDVLNSKPIERVVLGKDYPASPPVSPANSMSLTLREFGIGMGIGAINTVKSIPGMFVDSVMSIFDINHGRKKAEAIKAAYRSYKQRLNNQYTAPRAIGELTFELIKAAAIGRAVENASFSKAHPPNSGFVSKGGATLLPGARIDRFGLRNGRFLSPEGTPFTKRSLPVDKINGPYEVYEVVKPLSVDAGLTRAWYGQEGMGIQYQTSTSIQSLIDEGLLTVVGK